MKNFETNIVPVMIFFIKKFQKFYKDFFLMTCFNPNKNIMYALKHFELYKYQNLIASKTNKESIDVKFDILRTS